MREVSVVGGEWVLECQECTHHRGFGEGKLSAQTWAAKHMTSKRHRVHTYYTRDKVDTLTEHAPNEVRQLALTDEPPF